MQKLDIEIARALSSKICQVIPLTKLLISLGTTSGHLTLLNAQFMLDFLGLDLLAS